MKNKKYAYPRTYDLPDGEPEQDSSTTKKEKKTETALDRQAHAYSCPDPPPPGEKLTAKLAKKETETAIARQLHAYSCPDPDPPKPEDPEDPAAYKTY